MHRQGCRCTNGETNGDPHPMNVSLRGIRQIGAAVAIVAITGVAALAQPTANLSGVATGGTFFWTLSFLPDVALFGDLVDDNPDQGLGGSLAIAFQIETAVGGLVQNSWAVVPGFQDNGDGMDILVPGTNPYVDGAITEDVTAYTNIASDLNAGMVDAIFVPLGSSYFTSGGPKAALTFATTVDTVMAGGLVAQAGTQYSIDAFTAVGDLTGDFDADGDVDGLDFLVWQRADGTADGLASWHAGYGSHALTLAVVPEPEGWILGALLLVVFPVLQAKHRQRPRPS